MPKPRTMPIKSAETSAPAIEPMPPITVTMKLSIRIEKPMPGDSERTGAASAPASPASPPPTAKTIANSSVVLTPSAETIWGLIAAARTVLPSRVIERPSPSTIAISAAMPISTA